MYKFGALGTFSPCGISRRSPQTQLSRIPRNSIEVMTELVGAELMLLHILESDVYKQAIDLRVSPTDLGSPQLEYAIKQLAIDLKPSLAAKYQDLIKL